MRFPHWQFSLLAMISTLLISKSWGISDKFFLDADITFIFVSECSKLLDIDSNFPYFHSVRILNSYTPLRQITLCESPIDFHLPTEIESLHDFSHRETGKSARHHTLFIPLNQPRLLVSGYLTCEILLHLVTKEFRPDHVFGKVDLSRDIDCIKRAAVLIGTAKLAIFDDNLTSPLLIPCLTCEPLSFLQLLTFSPTEIYKRWNLLNKNMHKYSVSYSTLAESLVNSACSIPYVNSTNSLDPDFCLVLAIVQKYNLTLIRKYGTDSIADFHPHRNFGGVLSYRINYIETFYHIYKVSLSYVNFLTITNPPSPASGVATFVTPFDRETWICLLLTIIGLAGFLTYLEFIKVSRNYWLVTALEKLITVTSILLGQVGDTAGKAYRRGKVTLVILTLWLFGYLVLMANIYQGSIYSCLTVLIPPPTPHGVHDLIDWDILIVARDPFYNFVSGSTKSSLLDYIIPNLLSSGAQTPKFTKFLTGFQQKVVDINDNSAGTMLNKIITENTTKKYPSIAIFLYEMDFDFVLKVYKFVGNRRVVLNRGESPFRNLELRIGDTNLLTPYFSRDYVRMREAGLDKVWLHVKRVGEVLKKFSSGYDKQKYFEAVQRSFGNLKDPVTFTEATPVSTDLIRPVFVICGILMKLGVMAFLGENKKIAVFWGVRLVQWLQLGLLYFGKKLKYLATFCKEKVVTPLIRRIASIVRQMSKLRLLGAIR